MAGWRYQREPVPAHHGSPPHHGKHGPTGTPRARQPSQHLPLGDARRGV